MVSPAPDHRAGPHTQETVGPHYSEFNPVYKEACWDIFSLSYLTSSVDVFHQTHTQRSNSDVSGRVNTFFVYSVVASFG